MTRHFARKSKVHTLTIIAEFVATITVLASITTNAQVRNTGSANSDSASSSSLASSLPVAVESMPESGSVEAQSGSVSSGNSLFGMASSYAVGHDVGATQFVAVADVNGDGNPDLVVAGQNCAGGCSGGGKVSVLLAKSNGRGFQEAVVYDSGGQWCSSVAVADLTGDGKPDLVVTNSLGKSGGPVGVLLGNGDGTFRPAIMYGSGGRADSVVIADVNGDGKPDLIVAVDTTHVEVFLGNGDGTFQSGVPYDASGARSVAVADLNHDGKLDLVVAGATSGHPSSGMVSVLLGNGDGTFQPAVTYDSGVSSGGWANSVAVADFNGDGRPDLVVANYPDRTVGVLLGNGDGTFQPVSLFDSGASLAASVAAADLNGDGKTDIVVGDSDHGVGVLLGNGDGTFQPATMLNVGAGASSVAIADVNRDGRPDIVTSSVTLNAASNTMSNGSSNRSLVSVLLNTASDPYTTTTTVTSDLNPSVFGQEVKFTAVVSSAGGTPTGTVIFYDGSTQIRSSRLVGGSISMSTASLAAGSHSITAAYQGSSSFAPSTSAVLNQGVNSVPTTTTLVSSLNPAGFGDNVTFTATVTSSAPVKPFGFLIFYDGSTALHYPDMLSGGSLSLTINGLSIGTHSITASYEGSRSGSYQPSTSAPVSEVVNGGNVSTSTSLSSSPNPSVSQQAVTFVATVSSSSGTPAGTVIFYNGSSSIGSASLNNGSAALAVSSLAIGSNSITAAYQGFEQFAPSTSGALSQVVNRGSYATSTSLLSSLNPSVYGQAVVFTAAVSSKSGTPVGTVIFYDGSTAIGGATLANGSASISLASLPAGTQSITAAYQSSGGFAGSTSAALKQGVQTATTATSLVSSALPGHVNQSITYTAIVTSQFGGALTGTVTFEDGGTAIATITVSGNKAVYSTSYTAVGTHSITAAYSGDGSNTGSTSSVVTEKIFTEPNKPLPSTTTVTTSGSPSFVGQSVTFTATVTSTYGAIPDGELVTFYDDPDHTGKTEIATGTTVGGVASFSSASLAPKGHIITATYAGDAEFKSTSGTVLQTVDKYPTTTTLVASQNPTNLNEAVIFTATVTSAGPTPTGQVNFPGLGIVTLNGGVASISWDAHASCGRGVQAIYLGDDFNAPDKSEAIHEIVLCGY
jgi:Bacterial Ig-like domain (group 3)/FG-GAP-like repeat